MARSYQERAAVADVRICFAYRHTDAPPDGSNTFTRALREYVSSVPHFTIVDDLHSDYDVLFMNQLNRSPGSPVFSFGNPCSTGGENQKKAGGPGRQSKSAILCNRFYPLSGQAFNDRSVLDLLNMADFVIFQSAFQKTSSTAPVPMRKPHDYS